MSEQYLIEALNDSLDRLASGQTVEDCLRSYPNVADDLRILLELGQATSRARADHAEISGMRSRLDLHIDNLLEETEFRKPIFIFPQGAAVMLVASLLLVLVGFFILLPRQPEFAAELSETPSNTPELTQDADITPISTVAFSETPTATASPIETDTATMTETPSATISTTATLTETPSETTSPTETLIPSETPSPSPEPTACNINPPDDWQTYQVQAGNTLTQIAEDNNTTINELMRVNCLEDTIIREGRTLYIPSSDDAESSNTNISITQAPSSGNNDAPIVSTQSSDSSSPVIATEDDDDDESDDDESDDESDDDESDDEEDRSGSDSGSG